MTREKKELLKQLDDLNREESFESRMDMSGECGREIAEFFEGLKQPIYDRLNALMKGRLNDYFMASVVGVFDKDLPF